MLDTDLVVRVTVAHGLLLALALSLRAAYAPPLGPVERGVLLARRHARSGRLVDALAAVERGRIEAARRHGARDHRVIYLLRMRAELQRRRGDLVGAQASYEQVLTLLAERDDGPAPAAPGDSWMQTAEAVQRAEEASRTRIRTRRWDVGEESGLVLPPIQEGYERVLAERRRVESDAGGARPS